MTSFPNGRCHLKISSQKHFQRRVCHCFYLRKLLFVSLLDWILYSFSHYREYILPGTLSFSPPPTVEILPLPLLNQYPPAGESEAVKPYMSAWLERETLTWPGQYYFDFMWYFSLNWLEHFNQENSPPFPCPEWGTIQQYQFRIVTCQLNNPRGEGRQIKLGWCRARWV